MRVLLTIYLTLISYGLVFSQCSYVSGTLVNACGGTSEGINELVVLQIGNTDVNWNDMSITFPNGGEYCNSCTQKFTTNSTFVSTKLNSDCGSPLITQLGIDTDIAPANSKVLIFTGSSPSYDFDFSTLCGSGPYYIMFANNTSTTGRYANSANTNRTTSYDIDGCVGNATYYSSTGNTGTDGDAVIYNKNGVATYVNDCNAGLMINPITPLSLSNRNIIIKNTIDDDSEPNIIGIFDVYGKEVIKIDNYGVYIFRYDNGDVKRKMIIN
jgi:hypothetical protein